MVIGERFAYGHIPKTGGDAVHAWLAQIDGLHVDPIAEAKKHEFFWQRGIRKELYVLSLRRLPFWALSYLHELKIHPASAKAYGLPPGDTVRPEYAFSLRPDEYLSKHQAGGREIGVWLRMEHLFDDTVDFIAKHIQPVTPDLRQKLVAVPTKGKRNYDHDIYTFFTPQQVAALYRKFPVWAGIEKKVYGGLFGEEPLSQRPAA